MDTCITVNGVLAVIGYITLLAGLVVGGYFIVGWVTKPR